MAITTYAELKTALGSWINRADSADYADDAIDLFEAWANRSLRVRQMQQEATATIAERLELPSDFLEMRDLQFQATPRRQLRYVTPEWADIYDKDGATGEPEFYTITNDEIRIVPAPSTSGTVLMSYYKQIPALSSGNTTNWLLTAHPDAYLYGSLYQSREYITDDARAERIGQRWQVIMAEIQRADKRSERGGSLQIRVA